MLEFVERTLLTGKAISWDPALSVGRKCEPKLTGNEDEPNGNSSRGEFVSEKILDSLRGDVGDDDESKSIFTIGLELELELVLDVEFFRG